MARACAEEAALVLIVFDGSTPIFQIPVENIERIELTKGADSVLYGSERWAAR